MTSFRTVDDFVADIVQKTLDGDEKGGYSKEDDEKVQERLRSLGYLQ
jgi:hypothetical protein